MELGITGYFEALGAWGARHSSYCIVRGWTEPVPTHTWMISIEVTNKTFLGRYTRVVRPLVIYLIVFYYKRVILRTPTQISTYTQKPKIVAQTADNTWHCKFRFYPLNFVFSIHVIFPLTKTFFLTLSHRAICTPSIPPAIYLHYTSYTILP